MIQPSEFPVLPKSYAIVGKRIAAMMPYPVTFAEDAKCLNDEAYTAKLPRDKLSLEYMRLKCATCPLMLGCREWGIAHELEWGMFGGLNPDERSAIRKERGQIGFDPHLSYVYGLGDTFFPRGPSKTEAA